MKLKFIFTFGTQRVMEIEYCEIGFGKKIF